MKEQLVGLLTGPKMPTKKVILTGVSIAGVITTGFLSARGARQAEYCLDSETRDLPYRERIKYTWRCYVPAGISGSATIVAVLGSHRMNTRQAAALTAAFQLSERAYSEYRDKISETFGESKELKVRDAIAQDRVSSSPNNNMVIVTGTEVLCCELHTMRYFKSSMEELRSVENKINSKINRHGYSYLSDLYDELGLENTTEAYTQGWNDQKLLSLEFSSVLADGITPCLAFSYNYTTVI
jgi:hypothetical protein